MGLKSAVNMHNQTDTINSIQNSSLNITQLISTSTTSNNRRSRFRKPSQTSPTPEDEDIYVSLQVLQAQLKTQAASDGSPELIQRVLGKLDKLQNTIGNFSENYDFVKRQKDEMSAEEGAKEVLAFKKTLAEKDAQLDVVQKRHQMEQAALRRNLVSHQEQLASVQQEHEQERAYLQGSIKEKDAQIQGVESQRNAAHQKIVALQNELQSRRAPSPPAANQDDVNELRRQLADLYVKVERIDHDQEKMKTMQAKIQQQDDMYAMMLRLQGKVEQLETVQKERNEFQDKCAVQRHENDQLLRRVWALEVENGKLKEAVVEVKEPQNPSTKTTEPPKDIPAVQAEEPKTAEIEFNPRQSVFRPDASTRSTRFWKRANSDQLSAIGSDESVSGLADSIKGDETTDLARVLDEDNVDGIAEMLHDNEEQHDNLAQFVADNEAADLDEDLEEDLACNTVLSNLSMGYTDIRNFLEDQRIKTRAS